MDWGGKVERMKERKDAESEYSWTMGRVEVWKKASEWESYMSRKSKRVLPWTCASAILLIAAS